MAKKKPVVTNAMRMLNAAKINYDLIEYEHEGEIGDHFGMEISEVTGIAPETAFKTLVARGDKQGIMVVCVPVNAEVDLKKLAKAAGDKRVELIHVKELLSLTGYVRGGVSPIGMKKKYPTYVNDTAQALEKVAVSGGICGVTLLMAPSDLQLVTECKFVDIVR